jgi:biopolymer transport protein ExbD
MKLKRRKLLVEPPQSAMSDIAFILIIFFLVCASIQPDKGRSQVIPRSEEKTDKTEQSENVEVKITRDRVLLNGNIVKAENVLSRVRTLLAEKTTEADRVVVVKSREDTPYFFWIEITGYIEQAGGIVTLQLEEEREVEVN